MKIQVIDLNKPYNFLYNLKIIDIMPKSKNKKNHSERLAKYKANKKKEQEIMKKKMIDQYIKMQQQAVADKEAHTSTEETVGPDINIDDLNQIEDWEPVNDAENIESPIELVEPFSMDGIEIIENQKEDDNNNK
jgi:hypothetical protein